MTTPVKLYSISRVRLFEILAAFPNVELFEAGSLFCSVYLTDEQAVAINQAFPGAVWEYK